ncbi:Tyrosine N-monooxygenase [Acorus calamus]|uniref:Tyrosine N-monooxygenase n=1 Tax=Acorus calamus TaxID=4465 RepID=A0AAV9CBC1_ACOCL|nr:Tyrosine N-monooxygenase [Acorus calamus]
MGKVHIIPVTCPEIACEFLKRQDSTFASRPITMGTEYSSRNFLSVAVAPLGDQWKKMRRVVASEVINPARLQWLLEKRDEEADNLVNHVHNKCRAGGGGTIVDVRAVARAYSGNVMRGISGRADGGPGKEEEEHVEALFTVLSLLYAFCVSDYLPKLRWLDLEGHERIRRKAIRVVNKYAERIIDERMEKWRGVGGVEGAPEDLLDVMITLRDEKGRPLLSTEEIKAQSADLIYASVDNASHAAEWALAETLNQPELLKKAVDELDRVVGRDSLVRESDFPRLNYIKSCAREAFRLHPIAPFNLPHVAVSDATVAGYFIPKGSHVLLSRVGLGRNPKIWADPLRFDPERHMAPASAEVELLEPELRFISFSTGRRGCMGAQLGSAMTVMLLARVLQCFTWAVPPGQARIDLTEAELVHRLF